MLNNLIDQLSDQTAEGLTDAQKQNRLNLIGSLVAGITAAAGGEAAVAANAAQIETRIIGDTNNRGQTTFYRSRIGSSMGKLLWEKGDRFIFPRLNLTGTTEYICWRSRRQPGQRPEPDGPQQRCQQHQLQHHPADRQPHRRA